MSQALEISGTAGAAMGDTVMAVVRIGTITAQRLPGSIAARVIPLMSGMPVNRCSMVNGQDWNKHRVW